jgi:hypothetical protein
VGRGSMIYTCLSWWVAETYSIHVSIDFYVPSFWFFVIRHAKVSSGIRLILWLVWRLLLIYVN